MRRDFRFAGLTPCASGASGNAPPPSPPAVRGSLFGNGGSLGSLVDSAAPPPRQAVAHLGHLAHLVTKVEGRGARILPKRHPPPSLPRVPRAGRSSS